MTSAAMSTLAELCLPGYACGKVVPYGTEGNLQEKLSRSSVLTTCASVFVAATLQVW